MIPYDFISFPFDILLRCDKDIRQSPQLRAHFALPVFVFVDPAAATELEQFGECTLRQARLLAQGEDLGGGRVRHG